MGRKPYKAAGPTPGESESQGPVKKTFRLSVLTAKRLGVEAVMSGESESAIVERVLAAYLSGWRLPSKTGGIVPATLNESGREESAA